MQVTKFYCDICGAEMVGSDMPCNESSIVLDNPWWRLSGEWCIQCKGVMQTAILDAIEKIKADVETRMRTTMLFKNAARCPEGKDNSYQEGASGDTVFQSGPTDNRGGDTVMARQGGV